MAQQEWYACFKAGTLAFLGWSWTGGEEEPTEISVQVIQNAIDLLLSYFWPHARAALRQVGLSESRTNQRRILRWIRANHKTAISLQDIRRDALGGALDAPKTEELLSALVRSGWLRKSELPAGPKGGKPLKRWLINPVLFSSADTAQTAETLSRRSTSVSNPAPAVADRFLGGPDRLIWTPDDVPPF